MIRRLYLAVLLELWLVFLWPIPLNSPDTLKPCLIPAA